MAKNYSTEWILENLIKLFDRPEKWTKHTLKRGTRYCIVGGIGKICNNNPHWYVYEESLKAVTKVVNALRFGDPDSMVDWNNAESTTYEKFVARLHKGLERVQSRYGHK